MIGFCPLASGSKGNCIYLGTEQAKILIDAGISTKAIAERLAHIGVSLQEIDAVFITHEHIDHVAGLKRLMNMDIPVIANSETAKGIVQVLKKIPKFKIFATGEKFRYADMEVLSFTVPHDTPDPVAFIFFHKNMKLGFCTDLGFVTSAIERKLENCDYLYIEANHQVSMVLSSSRPNLYKQRVLGRYGHLSNENCGRLLERVLHPGLKHVHLAHLSSECNHPEVALGVVKDFLGTKGPECSIALQEKISRPVAF